MSPARQRLLDAMELVNALSVEAAASIGGTLRPGIQRAWKLALADADKAAAEWSDEREANT